MDISSLSIGFSQTDLMTKVSTQVLSMSLDNLQATGAQLTEMIAEAGPSGASGVMNSSHIDVLV